MPISFLEHELVLPQPGEKVPSKPQPTRKGDAFLDAVLFNVSQKTNANSASTKGACDETH